jgi:hypothetical protein
MIRTFSSFRSNGGGLRNGDKSAEEAAEIDDDDETVEVAMSLDELVCGSLESSFWAMDRGAIHQFLRMILNSDS